MTVDVSILATETGRLPFIEALGRRIELIPNGLASFLGDLEFEGEDGDEFLAIGELDGRTYVYDHYTAAISLESDYLAELSRELRGTVVGGGASSHLGHYWFVYARDGKLLRFHENSYSSYTMPYDVGERLPTELDDPLEDIDGVGLRAAFAHLGFDLDALSQTPLTPYRIVWKEYVEAAHREDEAAFMKRHWVNRNSWDDARVEIRRPDGSVELVPPESRLPRGEHGHTPRPQGQWPEPTKAARSWRRIFGR